MSYPNDTPAAAWYPDPQTPGLVRWWDGTTWTQHVSVPANPAQSSQIAIESSAPAVVPQTAVPQTAVPQTTVPRTAVPQIDEADAALAAADSEYAAGAATEVVTYIGRHAAGPNPAPRQAPRVPQIRPRQRAQVSSEPLLSA